LSPAHVGEAERDALLRAFDSGWIAPAGPELGAFETELADYVDARSAVALSSGTAALHLALIHCGVEAGDEVVVQSATFAASAFAVVHAGATPIFCDSEESTWCIDPDLLESFLSDRARMGRLPKAVLPVDLYGSCADYERLIPICDKFGVAIVRDAAEALGSQPKCPATTLESIPTAYSFNGNKIMTTSGGGALVGAPAAVDQARYLSTQARQPLPYYQHTDIGFNYRMSNLLAALGRAQLAGLEQKIEDRGRLARRYEELLPMVGWCPQRATVRSNNWLSVALLDPALDPGAVCSALGESKIEARHAWNPMHKQPVFKDCEVIGGAVSEKLFSRGICLPSGTDMTENDQDRVIESFRTAIHA
jgi:dTDP-4-amino-4,6-dideoxygalactose transaminase